MMVEWDHYYRIKVYITYIIYMFIYVYVHIHMS